MAAILAAASAIAFALQSTMDTGTPSDLVRELWVCQLVCAGIQVNELSSAESAKPSTTLKMAVYTLARGLSADVASSLLPSKVVREPRLSVMAEVSDVLRDAMTR